MTSFVHVHYPAEHPGVARVESVISAVRQMRRTFDGTRGLAALLLGAVVAALVVVADQVVDSWADGRLLAAWVVLWVVAFAALALFAGTSRRLAGSVVKTLDAWSYRIAQARADERLWATAQSDPRVMADLKAAMARSDARAPSFAVATEVADGRRSLRQVVQSWYAEAAMARADAQLWNAAQQDSRVMSDLRAAESRAEWQTPAALPGTTQILLRADQATEKASEPHDAVFSTRRHLAYYL